MRQRSSSPPTVNKRFRQSPKKLYGGYNLLMLKAEEGDF